MKKYNKGSGVVFVLFMVTFTILLWNYDDIYYESMLMMQFRRIGSAGELRRDIYIHERTGIEFVRIPGGAFRYGINEGDLEELINIVESEAEEEDEDLDSRRGGRIGLSFKPNVENTVTILRRTSCEEREFSVGRLLVSRRELSRKEWEELMGGGGLIDGIDDCEDAGWESRNGITWSGCREFEAAYADLDFRLPTEVEWQYLYELGAPKERSGSFFIEENWDPMYIEGEEDKNGIFDLGTGLGEWCYPIDPDQWKDVLRAFGESDKAEGAVGKGFFWVWGGVGGGIFFPGNRIPVTDDEVDRTPCHMGIRVVWSP